MKLESSRSRGPKPLHAPSVMQWGFGDGRVHPLIGMKSITSGNILITRRDANDSISNYIHVPTCCDMHPQKHLNYTTSPSETSLVPDTGTSTNHKPQTRILCFPPRPTKKMASSPRNLAAISKIPTVQSKMLCLAAAQLKQHHRRIVLPTADANGRSACAMELDMYWKHT